MSLKTLYVDLLTSTSKENPLTAEMQERIYAYAIATQENALLVVLARYPGLDTAIDDRIKTHDDLEVLVAWAGRRGRSAQQLSERLLSDKRVAVLKPLAALEGLPAEVYQTIAKIDSVNLAEALAGNTSVPVEIRIAKIREHARRHPRGVSANYDERLHKLCANPKGPNGEILGVDDSQRMYEAVAESTLVLPYVLACLSKPYVRDKDLDRWIENFEAIARGGYEWRNEIGTLVTLMASKNAEPARHSRLVSTVQEYITKHGQSYRTAQLQNALTKLVSHDQELEDMFRELATSTDPARADELVGTIRTRATAPEDLQRLAGIVARNQLVAYRHGMALLEHMRGKGDTQAFITRLEDAGENGLIHDIIVGEKFYGTTPMTLRMLSDENAFLRYMIERQRSEDRLMPDWAGNTAMFRDNPALAVELLTWKCLSKSFSQIPGLSKLVEKRILDTAQNNPAIWEAFNGLADGFDGNLEDLLGAAKTLGA